MPCFVAGLGQEPPGAVQKCRPAHSGCRVRLSGRRRAADAAARRFLCGQSEPAKMRRKVAAMGGIPRGRGRGDRPQPKAAIRRRKRL